MSKVNHTNIITMVVKESTWTQPPLKRDYKNAEKLLFDFGIIISIPKFETVKAMQEWTSKMIDRQLQLA